MVEQQTTLAYNDYQAGKLEVLEILEAFILRQKTYGRQYFSCDQLYHIFKDMRLNLEEKWKRD